MSVRVAILVLGYNHRGTLNDLFTSLASQQFSNFEVFYIDNASSDGSVDYVIEHFPDTAIMANERNLGYAGAYDIAIREVFGRGFDAAVLLNPDIVVDNCWLSELVMSAYAAPDIALAQSKVLLWENGQTNIINTFGNKIHFLGFGYCGHYKEEDIFPSDVDVAFASGSSLLVKKEFYPSKISLDIDYFAYLEDQDLGWQANLLGLRSVASAKSKVWHKYDFKKINTNNQKFYLLERNRLFFLIKFWSSRLLFWIFPVFIIMETGVVLHSIINGYFGRKVRAYWDCLRTINLMFKKRLVVQSNRKVSDRGLSRYLSSIIDFDEVNSPLLRAANYCMRSYFKIILRFL